MIFNDKINYLLCKWLVPPRRNHNEMKLRDTFNNKRKPTTKDEVRILSFKAAFSFLINNEYEKVTSSLKYLYTIEPKQIYALDKLYGKTKPDFDVLTYIVLKSELPRPFLILYYNALRFKHNLVPIVFRIDQVNRMMTYIKKGEPSKAQELFGLCLENTERYLIPNNTTSKEEITYRAYNFKEELKKLGVREILIYGSFARDDAHKYSDLDAIIITENIKKSDDYTYMLKKDISKILNVKTDLHIFEKQIDYSLFDKKMREDMVSIFRK